MTCITPRVFVTTGYDYGSLPNPLQWCHNEYDGVSNYRRLYCLLSRLFRRGSKKTSKLHVTGLCAENSPVTGEFPAQRASNSENVSIWWRHHGHQTTVPTNMHLSVKQIEGILPKGHCLPCVSMAGRPFWQDTIEILGIWHARAISNHSVSLTLRSTHDMIICSRRHREIHFVERKL